MSVMNSEKLKRMCVGVWRDRAATLTGRGNFIQFAGIKACEIDCAEREQ
jgi:hypothetical protein